MTLDEMTVALQSVVDDAAAQFEVFNPGRLAQLESALETAQMAAGYLFTEVPYHPAN